ncbi:MAG: tetratricopeptide repeat protein [Acidobacteriia bacterium]|nr:tetratricopeptide repeat protein [Terriglobia bacterium]
MQAALFCLLSAAIPVAVNAQNVQTKAQLDVSETLFTVTTALNSCGYDAGLEASLSLRQAVRSELAKTIARSPEAAAAQRAVCQFQRDHLPVEPGRDTAQYISLALDLGPPPEFKPTLPEADLPPDASQVLGVVTLLQTFYSAAGIHALWQQHQAEYEALIRRFHEPVANSIIQTDLYLQLQFNSAPGRKFIVYLEPMLAPSQVNSRNYGDSYFLVVSPGRDGANEPLRLYEIRHTYLHYVLDPLAMKHGRSLQRLEPILENVVTAPLTDSYKQDISLLANECLIRAIEARSPLRRSGRMDEGAAAAYVRQSMEEGYVLTQYFYEALAKFEKESTGMKDAYGDLLYNIDMSKEKKRATETIFARQSTPEVISSSRPMTRDEKLLDSAEQQLASGDALGAQKLATEALKSPRSNAEPGRAFFVLARAALRLKNMEGAQQYFERAIESAHDPRTLAWSHIYLGRILDIQEQRDAAVTHYRAALNAGDPTPDTRSAAEKGLAAPYQPQASPQN